MIVVTEPEQARAKQGGVGSRRRVVQASCLCQQFCFLEQECLGAFVSGRNPRCEVFDDKPLIDVGGRSHDGDGLSFHPGKSHAQGIVPAHDLRQALLERRHVERPLQTIGVWHIELGQSWQFPLDPEHALLGDGDRLASRLLPRAQSRSAGTC